jgi:hypothetical protein
MRFADVVSTWSYREDAPDWVSYEQRVGDVVVNAIHRAFANGGLVEQLVGAADGGTTQRFFPDASPLVIQPVTVRSALLLDADVACAKDADCVLLERADCCGCSAGGTRAAVSRRRVADVRRGLARMCGESTPCVAVISHDPSCVGASTPTCVEGTCALRRRP